MSTDRKRLTSAIQRIAREDPEIRKLLEDFRNSGGKPSETATSGSGAEDRQTCCDGSSSDNVNPGSDTRDSSEGDQDGLDSDNPADLSSMGPGSLTGVKDCATNEPVCFEGSDWIPPDGWESPTDPQFVEFYEEGCYWDSSYGDSANAATAGAALSKMDAINPQYSPHYFESGPTTSGDCTGSAIIQGEGVNYVTLVIDMRSCGDSTSSWCDPDDDVILEDFWPEDSCTNLAVKGGKIVGSKYDPENDGSYSAPRSSIELCDDFGNSFELAPSASGGWKSISSQNPGDGYLYDSKGKQIARISESEYSDPNV